MKTSDDGIMRMPSNMKADFAEAMLTKQLIDAGIDPRTIKNEQQMINVLDGIDNMKKQMAEMATKEKTGITSAKIMDMEGKEIPKGSKIMGGKAVDDDLTTTRKPWWQRRYCSASAIFRRDYKKYDRSREQKKYC